MPDVKPQKPLRVMLVDDRSDRRAMLDLALSEVGCALVACVAEDADLFSAVESCDPDVILIDIEAPGRDTLEGLETVQANVPRPMVMFSQDDNNETIKRATSAGSAPRWWMVCRPSGCGPSLMQRLLDFSILICLNQN